MKLIRVWPAPEINPLDIPGQAGDSFRDLAISQVVDYAECLLKSISDCEWRVSYIEPNETLSLTRGSIIDTDLLRKLLRLCLEEKMHAVFRDNGCRFINPMGDYYLYFGLAHEDDVASAAGCKVKIEDVSSQLIETDFFDV